MTELSAGVMALHGKWKKLKREPQTIRYSKNLCVIPRARSSRFFLYPNTCGKYPMKNPVLSFHSFIFDSAGSLLLHALSLVAMCGLLLVAASLAAEHWL